MVVVCLTVPTLLPIRIVSGESLIPESVFLPHPKPGKQHLINSPLLRPFVRTLHHERSFFINVVNKWNRIPASVVNSKSSKGFKAKLKKLIFS